MVLSNSISHLLLFIAFILVVWPHLEFLLFQSAALYIILPLYLITFTSHSLCYLDWHLCSATQTVCTEHLLYSRHCSTSWDSALNKSLFSLWTGGEKTKIRQTCQLTCSRKKNKAGAGYGLIVRMAISHLMWCWSVDWGSKLQFEAVWGSVFQAGETAVTKVLRWQLYGWQQRDQYG